MNSIQKECKTCIHRNVKCSNPPCFFCRDHDWWEPIITGSIIPISVAKTLAHMLEIEKVIYNDPATIVIWRNGGKTIVKCQPGDIYDPEKGLALCIMKRALGNAGNYNNIFRKWLPEKGDKE